MTDSIETSLAFITDSILGPWENVSMVLQVERTIVQLRLQLREAHEMFDVTDQRVEKAMMLFREELEQVEQIHQSDWEMSELQNDKIEKLFDVFERIDGRFCQLDLTQDELIQQLEGIRKYAQQKLSFKTPATQEEPIIKDEELGIAIAHLIQTFSIIQTVPIDPVLYLRDDRARLCKDLSTVVDQLLKEVNQFIDHKKKSEPIDEPRIQQLTDARNTLERRWSNANTILTKQKENNSKLLQEDQKPQRPLYQPLAAWKKDVPQLYSSKNPDSPSLNQLELSFDIHHSNLGEIQKDIEELTSQSENIMKSKKKMYDMCLSLEQELNKQQQHENGDKKRAVDEIQSELNQVLAYTKKLFDEQAKLEKEREQLKKEQDDILKELDTTEGHLSKVRPPLLLQGLLERLETDEAPIVRVEKDWKEDLSLVAEITDPENDSQTDDSYSTDDSEKSAGIGSLPLNLLASQYSSPLLKSCYTARLDSSLYCLKVLASHQIGKSKQHLLEVHASLNRATVDLDEIRKNMAVLYDDAAEVAQQVFVLKTELETIVRHRKEEVIKVWEVVDEVSEGVNARALELQQNQAIQNQQRGPNNPQQHQKQPNAVHEVPSHGSREEEKDRHQWIVRELEQLQHVHDGLEDSIEGLKREQVVIGENLKQLATTLIEPQVDRLVGSEDDSILSVSDKLAELMDRIKDSELGLKPTSFWSNTAAKKKPQTAIPASPTPVVNGVGVG